ncbi:MAG: hypothetical protein ACKVIF_07320, partial [Rhodospirillales bacterium]
TVFRANDTGDFASWIGGHGPGRFDLDRFGESPYRRRSIRPGFDCADCSRRYKGQSLGAWWRF